jgi:predicted transcriptional regulator
MARRPSQKPFLRTNHVSTYGLANAQKAKQPNATQARAVLPPSQAAMRRAIEASTCPWCGRGPWKSLAAHTVLVHGVSAAELRVIAGMLKKETICAPEMSAQRSAAAKANEGLWRGGPREGPAPAKRPRQLSEAAKEMLRERLRQISSPAQRTAALTAAHSPEANAKRIESLRAHADEKIGAPLHGTVRMYRRERCRCAACRAANNAEQRAYQRKRKAERGAPPT